MDLGINFIDTARGDGLSEERIGRWLPAHRLDEMVLSTKVGNDVEGARGLERGRGDRRCRRGIAEAGYRRDRRGFLHSRPLTVLEQGEAVEVLLRCVEAGKVRVPGYSGENEALAWAAGAGVFGAVQSSVNLADQRSLREVLPEASRRGLGIVAKRPLANAPWRHSERPVGVYGETYWLRLRELGLEPESDDWQGTALRFSAYTPGVGTAIVGTSRTANLEAAAAAVARGPLPATERARWENAFAPHAGMWPGEV